MKKNIFLICSLLLVSSLIGCSKEPQNKDIVSSFPIEEITFDEETKNKIENVENTLTSDYNITLGNDFYVVPNFVDITNDEIKLTQYAHINKDIKPIENTGYINYQFTGTNNEITYTYTFYKTSELKDGEELVGEVPVEVFSLINVLNNENIEYVDNFIFNSHTISDNIKVKEFCYDYKDETNTTIYNNVFAIELSEDDSFVCFASSNEPFPTKFEDKFFKAFTGVNINY